MQRHRKVWQRESKCVGDYAISDGETPIKTIAAYCSNCPVIKECLNYALLHEEGGSWGGLNRRALAKRRRVLGYLGIRQLVQEAVDEKWLEPHNLYSSLVDLCIPSPKPKAFSPAPLDTTPREDTRISRDSLSGLLVSLPGFSFPPLEEGWLSALRLVNH